MSVYRVTAKQVYYVDADSPEEARMHYLEEDEHVDIGFTEVTDVEIDGGGRVMDNELRLQAGGTPLTVADLVIRECNDREWLEDVIFYLEKYIERAYQKKQEGE